MIFAIQESGSVSLSLSLGSIAKCLLERKTLDLDLPPPHPQLDFLTNEAPCAQLRTDKSHFCSSESAMSLLSSKYCSSFTQGWQLVLSVSFWWRKKIKVIFKKLFQRFIWQAWRQVDEDRQDSHLFALFRASCRICNGESFEPQSPGRLFSLEWAKTRHIPQTFLSEQMVYMCLEINIKSI